MVVIYSRTSLSCCDRYLKYYRRDRFGNISRGSNVGKALHSYSESSRGTFLLMICLHWIPRGNDAIRFFRGEFSSHAKALLTPCILYDIPRKLKEDTLSSSK